VRRSKVISAPDAARIVLDADTIAINGFAGIGCPEALAQALERRFQTTGSPNALTLVCAAGLGDRGGRGLDHFAHKGMVHRVIAGHWGLAPRLGAMARAEQLEAYCLPQGVISHLYREIAGGRPGLLTRVGLHTFVDPHHEGGRLNSRATGELVRRISIGEVDYLFYPAFHIDVALVRGTTADPEGNVTLEREALSVDALSMAQAARNSDGVVIAQVERLIDRRRVGFHDVVLPGALVDAVVVASPPDHPQTFSDDYNPAFTGEICASESAPAPGPLTPRLVIARRAAMSLRTNSIVNLGVGIPEGVGAVAHEEGLLESITITIESGAIGGIPARGLSFGAVSNAQAVIDQASQFDFYDGGGLDQAFLGAAEVDADGNVNVSSFADRIVGAGGFIDISQNAPSLFFLGPLVAGATAVIEDGRLRITEESETRKFVDRVRQVTFNGPQARAQHQSVHYITDRAVFRLAECGLELIEIAPGLDLERDILARMAFRPAISPGLCEMDPRIFREGVMGLAQTCPTPIEDRFHHDPAENVVYVNYEGMTLRTDEDVEALAAFLDGRFADVGHRVHLIVNYDDLALAPAAAEAFAAMVVRNSERYALSTSRHSRGRALPPAF
jgi:propionate CoA-transferase